MGFITEAPQLIVTLSLTFPDLSLSPQQKIKEYGEPKWQCSPKRYLSITQVFHHPNTYPFPTTQGLPRLFVFNLPGLTWLTALPLFKSANERWSDSETWKTRESKRQNMHTYMCENVHTWNSSWKNTELWSCEMYPEVRIANVQGNRLWINYIHIISL